MSEITSEAFHVWATAVPIGIFLIALGFLMMIPCALIGFTHVCFNLAERWEYYLLEHKRLGYKQNPETILEAFKSGFNQ